IECGQACADSPSRQYLIGSPHFHTMGSALHLIGEYDKGTAEIDLLRAQVIVVIIESGDLVMEFPADLAAISKLEYVGNFRSHIGAATQHKWRIPGDECIRVQPGRGTHHTGQSRP